MFKYEWLKGYNLNNVTKKQMKPPFLMEKFSYNFDEKEFVENEQLEIHLIENEKDLRLRRDHKFSNVDY